MGAAITNIREALRLPLEQDELRRLRREELKRQIMVGIEQLNDGHTVVLDEETREGIKKRGRERLAHMNSQG